MSLLEIEVLAAFTMHSLPNSSTLAVKRVWIYLQASLKNNQEHYTRRTRNQS